MSPRNVVKRKINRFDSFAVRSVSIGSRYQKWNYENIYGNIYISFNAVNLAVIFKLVQRQSKKVIVSNGCGLYIDPLWFIQMWGQKTPSLLNLTFWFYISIFKHSLEIVWHICLYLYRCAMHIFAHHHWICMRFRFWWQSEGSASSTIQIFLVSDVRRCNLSHRLMMLCYLGLAFHFLLVYISAQM